MNDNTATDVVNLENLHDDCLVDAVEEHFESSHGPELEETAFTEDSTEGYEDSASCKICKEKVINLNLNLLPFVVGIMMELNDVVPEPSE